MKIFTTGAKKVLTFTLVMLILFTQIGYGFNYTREELEAKIDKIALERGVPSVLVKAIAQVESGFQHFNSNGTPKISISGRNIGLMQVGNSNSLFDTEKLKYDVDYNINAGIDVLLAKWNASVQNNSISSVGNMDPNILENWYFALWAYNGWVGSNNPNANSKAYQDKIYKICESYFEQSINKIDTSRLPSSGRPSRGLNVSTPSDKNYADIVQYNKNDLVLINSIVNNRCLYDTPSGNAVSSVNNDQMAQIIDGPILLNGYYWYKVQVNDKLSGWIERNWIKKIGDTKYGIYPFEDIVYHWSASSVMNLYNLKLISGKTSTEFRPDDDMSIEEFCALFSKVFNITSDSEEELRFVDKDEISPWAVNHIRALDEAELLGLYGENINSDASIGRGEITYIIAKHLIKLEQDKFDAESKLLGLERTFDINEAFKLSEIELPFKDVEGLADWQINNIKIVYSKKIVSGENGDTFNYNGGITRGAAASVMNKLYETYNK